jgi:hypothetical protein
MCPTQWFTPTMGTRHSCDSMRATTAQETRGPPMPGPCSRRRQRQGQGGGGVGGWVGWLQHGRTAQWAALCSAARCAAVPGTPLPAVLTKKPGSQEGAPKQGQAGRQAHLGERDAPNLLRRHPRLLKRLLHQPHRPLLVVQRSLPWQEAVAWGRDETAQQ